MLFSFRTASHTLSLIILFRACIKIVFCLIYIQILITLNLLFEFLSKLGIFEFTFLCLRPQGKINKNYFSKLQLNLFVQCYFYRNTCPASQFFSSLQHQIFISFDFNRNTFTNNLHLFKFFKMRMCLSFAKRKPSEMRKCTFQKKRSKLISQDVLYIINK